MVKHCEKCGTPLADNEKVCHKCGTPVRRNTVEETTEPTAGSTDRQRSGKTGDRRISKPFSENAAVTSTTNKGSDKIVMFISAGIVVAAIALALILKTGVFSQNNHSGPDTPEQQVAVTDGDDEHRENKSDETDDFHSSALSDIDEEPAVTEAPEEIPEDNNGQVTESADESTAYNAAEDKLVIDEKFVAEGWYTYYMSYLDAINHGGDISYLKHAADERKKSFKTNYEKYNKGFTFENLSFDVDKTDMKIKDIGNGKLEATCHAYVVNVCTEIATGIIEDNRVTLLGKLEIDSATGDYLLTLQQSDKEYSFGKHEMIHCAE